MKKISLLILFVFQVVMLSAQAGQDAFQFLNLPSGARSAAFGGSNISVYDGDLNLALNNPALLNEEANHMLGLNFCSYLSDIKFGSVAYAHHYKKHYFAAAIKYIDYGDFMGRSISDESMGDFTAQDMALYLMYAHDLTDTWSVGATMKPIYSHYERYSSFGLAFDAGLSYHSKNKLYSSGVVLRNVGWQFKGYYSIDGAQHREDLPFGFDIGGSIRLPHAPLRFSLTMRDLQDWDYRYTQTSKIEGEDALKYDQNFAQLLMRHTLLSVEFLPTENFYAMVSYNYRRGAEMTLPDARSASGFSFGAGLKLYKFRVGAAISPYQTGMTTYQFTLSTNIQDFIK